MIEALTYNTEYGKRLPEIFNWLSSLENKPDLVCFQEFPEDGLPKLNSLDLFSTQGAGFAPALTKFGKLHGELTVYNSAKLFPKNQRAIKLGENRLEKIYRRNEPSERSALITNFLTAEKKELSIINLHLTSIALHRERQKQLKTILADLESCSAVPTVMIGDYNYTNLYGKNSLTRFMAEYGFKKAGDKLPTHKLLKFPHQLDYLFYRDCIIENAHTKPIPYSDHLPLFATIRLP